jgi:putative lipoprotein
MSKASKMTHRGGCRHRLGRASSGSQRAPVSLALLVLMAETASAELAAAEASGGTAALVGPTWVAEDIGGRGVIDYLQSHITFAADGRAHGSGGCNNFSGDYALAGETLDLEPLASTKKGCPPAIMDQEARFHQALAQTRGYRLDKGLLYLLDARGAPVMRLWRRD